ncbi:MAG: hypothetical protein ACREJU_13330, partial [Nitrospiraceae bacterium]
MRIAPQDREHYFFSGKAALAEYWRERYLKIRYGVPNGRGCGSYLLPALGIELLHFNELPLSA